MLKADTVFVPPASPRLLFYEQIMAIDRSCCGSTVPGPNDLVIHHRNYKAELTEELYERLHFKVGRRSDVCSMPSWSTGRPRMFRSVDAGALPTRFLSPQKDQVTVYIIEVLFFSFHFYECGERGSSPGRVRDTYVHAFAIANGCPSSRNEHSTLVHILGPQLADKGEVYHISDPKMSNRYWTQVIGSYSTT